MRKDIEISRSKNIHIAAIKEWDADFLSQQWNIYIINGRSDTIETVLVMSRGFSEDRQTSVLRHNVGDIDPGAAVKIEFIPEEVLGFENQYLVTFFAEDKLYEKKLTFYPHAIGDELVQKLPVIDTEGILAK